MKRILQIIPVFAAVVFLSSCFGVQTAELSERLIIEAIGIDARDGEIHVTIQALDTGAGGSGEGTAANETTKIYNFVDSTPARAFARASSVGGLIPLYSHARILVLGKEAAEEKLEEILDFFLREYTARSDILIAAAEGKAEEIVSADITDGTTDAAVIERLITEGHAQGKNVLTPLYKFVDRLLTESDTAICPLLGVQPSETEGKTDVLVKGTALFRKDGRILTADEQETEGLILLNDETGAMTFALSEENGEYTLNTVKSKTKIKPSVKDGKAYFSIETDVVCDMTEYGSGIFSGVGRRETEEAEKLLADAVEEKEKRALEDVFLKHGTDICRFGRRILLSDPEFYKTYIRDMPGLTVWELKVSATVRRTGRETMN